MGKEIIQIYNGQCNNVEKSKGVEMAVFDQRACRMSLKVAVTFLMS